MISSHRLTIGAGFRTKWLIRLDELDIPHNEHRTLFDSVIIVKIYTHRDKAAYSVFMDEFNVFLRRLAKVDRELEQEELARKNRFRRLTFRKPLTRLPR